MWCKEVVDAIISTLGVPLEAEYISSPWGHTLRACVHACVMLDFTNKLLVTILVNAVRASVESNMQVKVYFRLIPLSVVYTVVWSLGHGLLPGQERCSTAYVLSIEPAPSKPQRGKS